MIYKGRINRPFLMKIFLDTADTNVIKEYFQTGLVDGVTTNPYSHYEEW